MSNVSITFEGADYGNPSSDEEYGQYVIAGAMRTRTRHLGQVANLEARVYKKQPVPRVKTNRPRYYIPLESRSNEESLQT